MAANHVMAADLVYNQLVIPPEVTAQLDCPHQVLMLDGVYFGLNAGYDSYRVGQSFTLPGIVGIGAASHQVFNASGPKVGIFAGYGRAFNWLYIAGELYANSSGAGENNDSGLYEADFNLRYSLGASIIPGILVNHSGLLYARFGYVRTLIGANETGLPLTDSGITQFENGLEVGIGLETPITYHLHTRLEVSHIQYGSFGTINSTQFNPSNTQLSLSLLYHFDIV